MPAVLPARRAGLLAALLAVSACSREPADTPAASDAPATAPDAAREPAGPPAAGPAPPAGAGPDDPVRLVSMAPGDRACTLTVQPDGGEPRTAMAAFEVCERTDYVGQRVVLRTERRPVAAASCEGDPECGDVEEVDLVTGLAPAAGTVASAEPEG